MLAVVGEGIPGDEGADGNVQNLEAIGGSNMAPFLTKLFQIVSAAATDMCIKWTTKGDSFVISDPDTFAREILPTYFKHNNIRSFIRQLNTYGFRKRTNISSTDEHLEFFHVSFRRDEPRLLTEIKRCHQPKSSSQSGGGAVGGGGGGGGAGQQNDDLSKGGHMSPDLDTIRNRVTELKTRLGGLQMEIRDYNQQMEQKVNLLMQILQTSSTPQGASQLQQQISRMQMANMGGNASQGQQGHPNSSSFNMDSSGGIGNYNSQPLSTMHTDYLSRRDSLLTSIGHQHGMGGMGGGLSGLGGMPGLGGMSGLGGGNSLGGLGGGMGGFGGMGGMSGLGGMAGLGAVGQKNGGADGGVAGLQHLLEAAQRYQTEDDVTGRGGGERPAKRFCAEASSRTEEAAHA